MAWHVPVSCLGMLCLAGCSQIKPDAKIEQAADLVGEHTGHRPDWLAPWDSAPPARDAHGVLTCDQAVVIALRNNRDLRADVEMIGQANADLVQAGLMQNPVINFMMMFPAGGGAAMLRGAGLPMQPLQDLWLIPVRTKVAQRELQQAVLRVADQAIETAADVKRVYARLQYAQRAIELIRENIEVVRQSTEIIRIRQVAGQSTQVEVTLSGIRSMRLESDLIATEAEYRNLKRELLLLMGEPSAEDGWTVTPVQETAFEAAPPLSEDELLKLAEAYRLDLQAAEWTVRAAEQRIRLRRREGWPELALGLSFERSPAPQSNNPRWLGEAGNTAARGLVDRATGMPSPVMLPPAFSPKMREVKYTIGPMLDLEIPIFDWGQAQIARAIHEWRQRVADYDALAQQIVRDVRQTRVTCRQAYDQLAFYRDSILPAVDRNLQLARQSFTAGRESITVYLSVEADLISTRLKALEFLREYLVTRAELERQIGGRSLPPEPATRPAGES